MRRTSSQICPAYAGMILDLSALVDKEDNLSRVCGDDPGVDIGFERLY